MTARFSSAALTLLFLLVAGTVARADGDALLDLASFRQSSLSIRGANGERQFIVWLAATPAQQRQGLMFVRDLPPDRGMLFVHDRPVIATMWMKNTYIPLDMLFINEGGKIVRLLTNTKPFSLDMLSSRQPVRAVLELKGGESERQGLRVGDLVTHEAFKPARKPKRPAAARL
jgi:uncharacterized membrane protein (UPF0127 family)